ncbi:MAG: YihY/virulence factor BrkB family protein [Clostridiaceae bacterium]|nr:YihY/virulence factor BrkB family protein [Clostridiaceae bacterium]
MTNKNNNKINNKYSALNKKQKAVRRKSWVRIIKDIIINGPQTWRGKRAGRYWDYSIDFIQMVNYHKIGDKAAGVVYYLLLAFVPLLMLVMFFVSLIGRNIEITPEAIERIRSFLPEPILHIIESLTINIRSPLSTISLIVTIIMALWAASRGIGQVFTGIATIYPPRDNTLPLPPRIFGIVFTLFFFILLTLATVIMSFGRVIFNFLNENLEFLNIKNWVIDLITYGFSFFVIFIILYILYYTNSKRSVGNIPSAPGALFATIGWIILSYVYSFYIANRASLSTLYGSLANIVILMLWLNFTIQILLYGAMINYQRSWYSAQRNRKYIKLSDIIRRIGLKDNPFNYLKSNAELAEINSLNKVEISSSTKNISRSERNAEIEINFESEAQINSRTEPEDH